MRPPFSLLLASSILLGQTAPTPQELFKQGKELWTVQGNREEALARLEQAVTLVGTPGSPELRRLLCETFNLLAVLDDRAGGQKARVPQRLQAILDLDPDFVLDRLVTNPRLIALYERTRDGRFLKVEGDFQPTGGALTIDGRPYLEMPRWLPPGKHVFTYAKPGYQTGEASPEWNLGAAQKVSLSLTRVSSTVNFITHPAGVEILLDGKVVGKSSGRAGLEARETAERLGVPLEELSAPFVVEGLLPGKHTIEVRMPCYQPRRFNIPESWTTPPNDNPMDPVRLSPAKGTLTVTSIWKGGEAFLDGQSLGPLPLQQKAVCPGTYQFTVKYAAGGFARNLDIADGQSLTLEARPKPRLTFLGIEGVAEYPGKARLTEQLKQLGTRLGGLAYSLSNRSEPSAAQQAQLKASGDAELVLWGRTVLVSGATLVELHLATLDGFEEQWLIKPLDQEPLGELVTLLDTPLPLSEPSIGAQCLDLPGEGGPWVLRTDEASRKAGLVPFKPITQVNGKAVTTVAGLRAALALATGPTATVVQEGRQVALPCGVKGLQLPLAASSISYVRALAELRLKALGSQGDEAALVKLNLAQVLLHFRKTEAAMEILRETRFQGSEGIGQGTLAYITGVCLSRLGTVYIPDTIQAFQQALKSPGATVGTPDGPRVEPLAKAALLDLQPQ